jgi:hypothetical protein
MEDTPTSSRRKQTLTRGTTVMGHVSARARVHGIATVGCAHITHTLPTNAHHSTR